MGFTLHMNNNFNSRIPTCVCYASRPKEKGINFRLRETTFGYNKIRVLGTEVVNQ